MVPHDTTTQHYMYFYSSQFLLNHNAHATIKMETGISVVCDKQVNSGHRVTG